MTKYFTLFVLLCAFCSSSVHAQVFKKIQSEGEGIETCEALDQLNTVFTSTITLKNIEFDSNGTFCKDIINAPCDLYIGYHFEGFGDPIFEEITSCMFDNVKQTKTDIFYSGTLEHRFSLSHYISECDNEFFEIIYHLDLFCKTENGDFIPVDFCANPAFLDIIPSDILVTPCSVAYRDVDTMECCEDPDFRILTEENIEVLSVNTQQVNLSIINNPQNTFTKKDLPYYLINTSGQIIQKGIVNEADYFNIDISGLRSGLYYIVFETHSEIVTKKIFK